LNNWEKKRIDIFHFFVFDQGSDSFEFFLNFPVADRPETCRSTREVDFPFKQAFFNVTVKGGIRLRPGAPCNNFRGYCDIFYRCRRVDGDGPLRRLTTSLFSPEALENAASWITVRFVSSDFLLFSRSFKNKKMFKTLFEKNQFNSIQKKIEFQTFKISNLRL
jgi:hypothetical protein